MIITLEFIEVGKKEPALDALYDVIKSKKHRTWQNKIHEPILFKYLELCVELRRSHVAKEGLYQYKLICQQVNIASLEDVIRYFLKLAEDRAETARKESRDQVPMVEDLDQIMTPERYCNRVLGNIGYCKTSQGICMLSFVDCINCWLKLINDQDFHSRKKEKKDNVSLTYFAIGFSVILVTKKKKLLKFVWKAFCYRTHGNSNTKNLTPQARHKR